MEPREISHKQYFDDSLALVIPFLKEYLLRVFLMFHCSLTTCVDAIFEYIGFEESNSRMDM